TITVKADKGYKLVEDSLKVYKTNKSGPRVEPIIPVQDEQDNTKYTFVMPAFDVTVTAEFEKTEWQKLADAMSGKEQGTVDGVFEVDDTTTPGTRIITLLTDIKADNAVDSALVVPTACKVVLDLNGHILDRGLSEKTENGHVIKVEYGGELTLRDSDPTADNGEYKGGVITGGNTKKTGGGIWVNGGKLIMEGGTIANNYALNQNGGGVAVCENVRYSGGVIIDKGVFVMKGGVIRDNYAYVGGGVSALAESEIELIGGTITNNRALSKAGGVYAGSAKTVCKIGGSIKITGNYCSYVLIGATRYMPEGFDDVNANTTEQNLYLSYINKENYAKISISEVAPTTMDVKFTEEHTVSEGETLTIIESLPEEFKASILQYLQMENTENEECYVNEEGKTVIHIPVYLVNIADVTGGSVTADVSFFEVKSFEPDTKTVELTVVPDEGYLFKSLKVTYIDGTEKTVILEQNEQDNTKYTFVMPAFDVTVTAEFEEIKDSGVWFDYCTEQAEYDTSIGAGGNMYWGIRIPKAELQKLSLPVLEKIAFYEFEYTGTHTLFIFQPNANSLPALDSYIHSQQITVNGINDWHEVILTTPITVDVDKDLWIILYDEDMVYPGAGSAYTGDLNGTLANVEGEWVSIIDYGFYYTWMLRGYFSVTPQYTVSGTVTSFGSETDDITIQLIKNGETDAAYETTVNGNTATYNIEKVLDGDYTLKVTKKGHATRTYDVTVSGAPVELDLEIRHLGDLNGDGRTNKSDMSLLKDHINKTELLIGYDENVGDLNIDGDVGNADLAVLKNHINRIELLY
ncbi:MAG: hypothetical protein KBS52_00175, partial [Clostridiales bacterium]|nr:hypothetical protein [Candidatus Equinaster intestinalis]